MRPPSRPAGEPVIADLHDRSLEAIDTNPKAAEDRFMAWFDDAVGEEDEPASRSGGRARAAEARPDPDEETEGERRVVVLRVVATVVATMAAAAALWLTMGRPAHRSPIDPREPPVAASTRAAPPAANDPCARPTRAAGAHPLFDDFEDGNELVAPHEARNGYWFLLTDTDPRGAAPVLKPSLRPDASAANRYAIHAVGGPQRTWGASIQSEFGPSCYDVSAYSGIAFDARGPGRMHVGVREVAVIPVDLGGTCTHDCYDAHAKSIDLDETWRTYVLRWSELRQDRAGAPPLDVTRVQSLEFRIRPEDTPYDVWIDDVRFER